MAGLAGIFFSPSRGLLFYMPISLVTLLGARWAWKAGGVPRYGLALATACHLALWAKYSVWWGGHSYGPRLAADLAIPMALLAACALSQWPTFATRARAGILAALIWSVGVQGVGAIFYPAGGWNALPVDVDRAHGRLWDWRDSQIPRTLRGGPYSRIKTSLLPQEATFADTER